MTTAKSALVIERDAADAAQRLQLRRWAREVLGFAAPERLGRAAVPVEEMTRDALVDMLHYRQHIAQDVAATNIGAMKAAHRRMGDLRKAKRLANARADKAEAVMRAMLDAFSERDST